MPKYPGISPYDNEKGTLGTAKKRWEKIYVKDIESDTITGMHAEIENLATTAENSVANAVAAKNAAVDAKTAAETAAETAATAAAGIQSVVETDVDSTLSIPGVAADAKVTGDWLNAIAKPVTLNTSLPATAYAEEYMKVTTDSEGRVLYGVKRDGTFTWQKGTPQHVIDACNPTIENPEYLYVMLDTEGHIILGVKHDGSVIWQKGTPQHVIDACNPTIENPEYLYVILDKNNRVMFGIKCDGSFDWQKGIPYHLRQYIENYVGSVTIPLLSPITGKRWAALGDSITAGGGSNRIPYQKYVAEATGVIALNYGISGTGYMRESSSGADSFLDRVQNINPDDFDFMTIFGSGNDNHGYTMGNITDTTDTTILGRVNLTIEAYLDVAKKPLGIVTPYPWLQYPPSDSGNWMEEYSNAIIQVAHRHSIPVLDLYHESGVIAWNSGFRAKYFAGDGAHINSLGAKTYLMPMFREFIYKLA